MGIEEMIIAIFVGSLLVALLAKLRLVDLREERRISAGAALFGQIFMITFPMIVMSLFIPWKICVIPWLLITPFTCWDWLVHERKLAEQDKKRNNS